MSRWGSNVLDAKRTGNGKGSESVPCPGPHLRIHVLAIYGVSEMSSHAAGERVDLEGGVSLPPGLQILPEGGREVGAKQDPAYSKRTRQERAHCPSIPKLCPSSDGPEGVFQWPKILKIKTEYSGDSLAQVGSQSLHDSSGLGAQSQVQPGRSALNDCPSWLPVDWHEPARPRPTWTAVSLAGLQTTWLAALSPALPELTGQVIPMSASQAPTAMLPDNEWVSSSLPPTLFDAPALFRGITRSCYGNGTTGRA